MARLRSLSFQRVGRGCHVQARIGAGGARDGEYRILGVMQNALNLMHVSAYFQYVWTGGLTLAAVAGYSLRLSRRQAP